jgi:hypothetical protein
MKIHFGVLSKHPFFLPSPVVFVHLIFDLFVYGRVVLSMEGKSVIPMDEPFLDQWRIYTMYNTFRTYRYLYSYSLGSLIFFLVCLFSFSGLPRDSCANNAANILSRTERNIPKLTVIFFAHQQILSAITIALLNRRSSRTQKQMLYWSIFMLSL